MTFAGSHSNAPAKRAEARRFHANVPGRVRVRVRVKTRQQNLSTTSDIRVGLTCRTVHS